MSSSIVDQINAETAHLRPSAPPDPNAPPDIVTLGQHVRRSMSAASKSYRASRAAMSRQGGRKHYEDEQAHLRRARDLINTFIANNGRFTDLPTIEEQRAAQARAEAEPLAGLMDRIKPYIAS